MSLAEQSYAKNRCHSRAAARKRLRQWAAVLKKALGIHPSSARLAISKLHDHAFLNRVIAKTASGLRKKKRQTKLSRTFAYSNNSPKPVQSRTSLGCGWRYREHTGGGRRSFSATRCAGNVLRSPLPHRRPAASLCRGPPLPYTSSALFLRLLPIHVPCTVYTPALCGFRARASMCDGRAFASAFARELAGGNETAGWWCYCRVVRLFGESIVRCCCDRRWLHERAN